VDNYTFDDDYGVKMKKLWVVYLVFCINSMDPIYAQWTETDSLWLQNMIEGKDTIRLNPETMRAIREGTFLNRENHFTQPLEAPPILPVTRDFWDIALDDSLVIKIDSLSPAVLEMLMRLKEKDCLGLSDAFRLRLKFHEREKFRIGNSPFTVSAGAQNLLDETVKDGQRRGSVGGSVGFSFLLDDILNYLFRPSERQKRKNKKRAEKIKYYNATP
jgi:hypothetical protein